MTELGQVLCVLDGMNVRLNELADSLHRPMNQTEFAKRIGKQPKTVNRWVKDKLINSHQGLIPYSEIRKFLS